MCVSLSRARFAETVVMNAEVKHPTHGLIHTLVYQNLVVNLDQGPNAMILHLPAIGELTPANLLDTRQARHLARDLESAIIAPSLSRSLGMPRLLSAGEPRGIVHTFEFDVYSVVLAQYPSDVPAALSRVPADRRPAINNEIFSFYERVYPGNWLALCCFNNRDAKLAAPLMFWYHPSNPRELRVPAIDAHDGSPPRVGELVDVDHAVIFGSHRLVERGQVVRYTDQLGGLADFLPQRIIGERATGRRPNGDWAIPVEDVRSGDESSIYRTEPSLGIVS